jgi:hypothetical protein
VTKLKKNLKDRFSPLHGKPPLRKRALIETVNDRLKNISQVGHTYHHSLWNFPDKVAGPIAYSWREMKPSVNIQVKEQFFIST